jgi:hypothetical protein
MYAFNLHSRKPVKLYQMKLLLLSVWSKMSHYINNKVGKEIIYSLLFFVAVFAKNSDYISLLAKLFGSNRVPLEWIMHTIKKLFSFIFKFYDPSMMTTANRIQKKLLYSEKIMIMYHLLISIVDHFNRVFLFGVE